MTPLDTKRRWNWKTILLNLVIVVVVFNLGFALGHREGWCTLILDGQLRDLQALAETNVVPRRIVEQ